MGERRTIQSGSRYPSTRRGSSDTSYSFTRYTDGSAWCTCPGWRFAKNGIRECVHREWHDGGCLFVTFSEYSVSVSMGSRVVKKVDNGYIVQPKNRDPLRERQKPVPPPLRNFQVREAQAQALAAARKKPDPDQVQRDFLKQAATAAKRTFVPTQPTRSGRAPIAFDEEV